MKSFFLKFLFGFRIRFDMALLDPDPLVTKLGQLNFFLTLNLFKFFTMLSYLTIYYRGNYLCIETNADPNTGFPVSFL